MNNSGMREGYEVPFQIVKPIEGIIFKVFVAAESEKAYVEKTVIEEGTTFSQSNFEGFLRTHLRNVSSELLVETKDYCYKLMFHVEKRVHPDLVELWVENNAESICRELFQCEYISSKDEGKATVKSWFRKLIDTVDKIIGSEVPVIDHMISKKNLNFSESDAVLCQEHMKETLESGNVYSEDDICKLTPEGKAIADYHDELLSQEKLEIIYEVEYCDICESRILPNGDCSNFNCVSHAHKL